MYLPSLLSPKGGFIVHILATFWQLLDSPGFKKQCFMKDLLFIKNFEHNFYLIT